MLLEDVWDSIWGWIRSRGDWLGDVWGSIKEKFWGVIHSIGGFFTGKDTEGNTVGHSIPGAIGAAVDAVTSGIASAGLFFGDLWNQIWTKIKSMWGEWDVGGGGIRGWIYDNIVEKLPTWESIKKSIEAGYDGAFRSW